MKVKRRNKIIELIKNNEIETQEDLLKSLGEAGFIVTQSTVSRDVHDLNITKMYTPEGKMIYGLSAQHSGQREEKFIRIFKEGTISIDQNSEMLVIKTLEGMAMAVAAAIDAMDESNIMGTIAGDDTIFCAVKSYEKGRKAVNRFKSIIASDEESEEKL